MKQNNSSLVPAGIIGIIILLGLLFFKWLPEWTWQPKAPEITINEFIFERNAVWSGDEATIGGSYPPSIYIRVRPDEAADKRANLSVKINSEEVADNCSYSANYFCYKIDDKSVANNSEYEIAAKNSAGEKRVKLKVKLSASSSSSSDTEINSSAGSEKSEATVPSNSSSSGSSSTSDTSAPSSTPSTTPYVKSSSCLHYEAGRCWDKYEDEMYSSGLYDHNYGYYGASYVEPDNCDSYYQDILQDAYEEGYYDY